MMRGAGVVVLALACVTAVPADELAVHAPQLAALLRRVESGEAKQLADELRADPHAEIMRTHVCNGTCGARARAGDRAAFPVVGASGMGDSCFNAGMESIVSVAAEHLGVYGRCVPTGDNVTTDTLNSFLMTMDDNVDEFAARVRADENLRAGFNAFGVSQGSNVIRGAPPLTDPQPLLAIPLHNLVCTDVSERDPLRLSKTPIKPAPISWTSSLTAIPLRVAGYIQKYNDPPVISFMALSSPIVGVAAFPMCPPDGPLIGVICQILAEFLGALAYLPLFQGFLFQANYYRDPTQLSSPEFMENSQLAAWNNEGDVVNATFRENFLRTQQLIAVMALQDEVTVCIQIDGFVFKMMDLVLKLMDFVFKMMILMEISRLSGRSLGSSGERRLPVSGLRSRRCARRAGTCKISSGCGAWTRTNGCL